MKNSTLYLVIGTIIGFWIGYAFYDYNMLHEELYGEATTTLEVIRLHSSEVLVFILSVAAPFGIKLYKEKHGED